MRYRLKPKDNEVFDYIISYKKENDGCAPSVREIAVACEISSTSQADACVMRLALARKIEFSGFAMSRSIRVVGGQWAFNPPAEPTP